MGRLAASPAGLGLLTQSLLASGDTAVDEHVTVIADALARGAIDSATIDEQAMFVATMSDLGPVHIRVLLPFAGNLSISPVNALQQGLGHLGNPSKRSRLPDRHPELKSVLAPIVATLLRHGLIREIDDTSRFPSSSATEEQTYKITDYGIAVLTRLLAAGALKLTAND